MADRWLATAVEFGGRRTAAVLENQTGETVAYLPKLGDVTVESAAPLANSTIDSLVAAAGVLSDLFPAEQRAVA